MPDLTPAQLLRIADLLRYPPSAADADERWELVITLRKQATDGPSPLAAADVLAACLNDYLDEQQAKPPHRGWVVHWELILDALAGYLDERDLSRKQATTKETRP